MRLYVVVWLATVLTFNVSCGSNNGVRGSGQVGKKRAAEPDTIGQHALLPDSVHHRVKTNYPMDADWEELPDSLKEEIMKGHDKVDKPPHPVGGIRSLAKKLRYTKDARVEQIEGRVLVQFGVLPNGTVCCAKVIQGLDDGLDKFALKAVRTTKFEPETINGKPVAVKMEIPLRFNLD